MGFKLEDIVHPEAQPLAKEFICTVCLCIFDDPVQTVCDHIFCKDCLRPCLACPTCKTALGSGTSRPLNQCNRPLLRLMHNLKVWCPYHVHSGFKRPEPETPASSTTAGASTRVATSADEEEEAETEASPPPKRARAESEDCRWEGSYADLLAHHLPQCLQHWVPCPKGCGERVQRKGLEAHAPQCTRNFDSCTICGEQLRFGELSLHRSQKAELHVQLLEARCSDMEASTAAWRQLMQEELGNLKLELRKQCSERKFCWDAGMWSDLLQQYPKDSYAKSKEFWLSGLGPFTLLLYPNGSDEDLPGTAGVYVAGPSDKFKVSASFRCGSWEATFHDQRLPEPPAGHGFRNSLRVPVAGGRCEIAVDLQSVVQYL